MGSANKSSYDLSGFFSDVKAVWEWFEHLFAAIWGGLGWPHATLIMFIVGICFFRREIKNIIPRIKRVGASGVEVDPQPPLAQPVARSEVQLQSPHGQDYPGTFSIALGLVQGEIANKNPNEQIQYLVATDAGWRVLWLFENTYAFIFGGQIQLLQLLNQRGITGLPLAEAVREWDAYKERFKPNLDEWQMKPFLDFLIARELITLNDDTFFIAPRGREFLTWMVKNGRSPVRPW
ncbi:winged helix-turn-helix domain-containing protein [Pseudomonas sp. MAFF 302030]|uniref:Winged helix-turn-helix domain-containing protein n=1 Tax=Pseudomonas morbosilactucae TaxID=2938197 RepID=A0A9X2C8P1_9PSED|nr:hypothetical protein [Pseudomonas morbosilactucae]MCK9801426.1 winged helix-turn-helix domain-containing protein [Pseudomonas morbosilactucae]